MAERTDPNAVIVSMLHSGSLRYYGGRMTINYANLDAAWLERAASWLNSHGAHPYALLEDHEVKDFRKRFWPQGDASQIAMKPSIFYDGPSKIYFFDLAPSPGSTVATETIVDPSPEVRVVSPVAPPVLVAEISSAAFTSSVLSRRQDTGYRWSRAQPRTDESPRRSES